MRPYQLETGAEIDGFRIGKKLHQGGMASVWSVSRDDIDFPIIMKVPIIADGDDATSIVGFEMEQMILPHLQGAHVPRFVAQGDFTAQPYLVMERIEGPSLLPKLAHVPLPVAEVTDIGVRIATALSDLHRQRVQHLDLKPSNIMLRPSGEVVFIDFGLSRHHDLPDLLQEEFRLPMGTGPYIAPEQLAHVRSDPRSDIFALGVLLYFFATGTRPFGNPQGSGALRRRLWHDPAPPRALKKDVPPYLQEVILHCLEIEADDRYQNAAQIAFDLSHPDQLQLTTRAERLARSGFITRWQRRVKAMGWEPKEPLSIESPAQSAPIILTAVDLSPGMEPLAEAIRAMAARLVKTMPLARLACINILRTHRIGIDYVIDEQGRNLHVTRLVALKGWAQPLKLDTARITFHVLEAPDPAAAIIDFAKTNHVDQIIIGARGSSTLRRYLGSVSAQVVAEAPCTVIVVRAQGQSES
ncbi:serine/threonine protein kinase [Methylovirgula sp. 4M-Z18]|uniref:serine/threonine protein kinase n=1 Tax=Methylovirgula sp. 4M-Z18 TaxID=2293567 RepID=UPI000E2FD633|nr:bifunctional serine/threonine-protein kinase/universal stress protein [Methylovirgula sp. 4M-Z18]RFB79681.1 serine/threonine protein kinase [Methylovirgula sp. 4M-Z18]